MIINTKTKKVEESSLRTKNFQAVMMGKDSKDYKSPEVIRILPVWNITTAWRGLCFAHYEARREHGGAEQQKEKAVSSPFGQKGKLL